MHDHDCVTALIAISPSPFVVVVVSRSPTLCASSLSYIRVSECARVDGLMADSAGGFSSALFVKVDGNPLEFYIAPGPEKARLKPLIEASL